MKKSKLLLAAICGSALVFGTACPASDDPEASGDGDNDDGADTEDDEEEDDDSNLDESDSNSASMSGQGPTTNEPTSGPSSDTDDPSEDESDDNGFINPPDGGIEGQCDPAEQDCPKGQKCTGFVSAPGGATVDANHCVEIMGELQFGESCTRVEGNDDCAAGFFCMTDVSGNVGTGICREYCAIDQPCEFGGECFAFNDGQLPLCETLCNPLAPGECAMGQGCYPAFDRYVCAIPGAGAGQGADGDTCQVIQSCNPGLFCSGQADGCMGETGCCTDFCDLSEADPCTSPEVCTALADDPMPGLADVGGCVVPM